MNQITGKIIKEYILKFPKTQNLALARKLYKMFPEVFNSLEHTRTMIRYYRGAKGIKNKKYAISKTPKFDIPENDHTNFDPFIISEKYKCGAILSDIHFPYHSKSALEIVLEDIYKSKCDFIVLNGDIVDFHQCSVFLKDPRKKNIKEEIDQLEKFLLELRKNFKKTKIIYKFGNHEERYDSYIMQRAAELFHIDAIHLENILKLKEKNIEFVNKKRIIKYKNLSILHGHEYNFRISNPVNPARGIFLRAHESTLIGHFHQTSEHSETRLNGELLTCWSTGCLCDLHPDYAPLNKWTLGFAKVKSTEDKYFMVENKRIIKNKIV